MNQGFGREKRLLDAKQFKAVFDSPDYRLSGRCILLLARNNAAGQPRLGLVIGKKNTKLAVDRNQIKRHTREFFRQHQHQLPNVDLVVISRRGISDLSAAELRQELDKQAKRLLRQQQKAQDMSVRSPSGQDNA